MRFPRAVQCVFVTCLCLATGAALEAQAWEGPAAVGLRVTDEDGQPIADAQIVARISDADDLGPPTLTTDAGGRAVISGLREGEWFIEVSHPTYMLYAAYIDLRARKKPVVGFSSQVNTATSWKPMTVKFQKATADLSRGRATKRAESKPPKVVRESPPPQPEPPKVVRPEPEPPRVVRPEPQASTAAEESAEVVEAESEEPIETAPEAATPVTLPEPAPQVEVEEPAPAPAPVPVPQQPEVVRPESQEQPVEDQPVEEPPAETPAEEMPTPTEPAAEALVPTEPPMDEAMPEEEPTAPTIESEAAQLEALEPETLEPEALEPEAIESEVVEPEAVEPEAVETAVAEAAVAATPEPAEATAAEPTAEPAAATERVASPPAPMPQPAEPAPSATSVRLPRFLRSAAAGTCQECESGEWAVAAEQEAARAGDIASERECSADYLAGVAEAAQRLADASGSRLENYTGPILTALFRLDEGEPKTSLQDLLGSATDPQSNCQMAGVVLPPTTQFSGYVLEAWDSLGGRACRARYDCAVGQARWLDEPQVIEGAERTVVYTIFKNRSTRRERRLRMTIYFRPDSEDWTPRTR